MVAVVEVMSMVAPWTCQWPMKRAPAVAEGTAGLELALGALVVAGDPALEGLPVVEDVPVPDVFFEHPAAATLTITVAAMATSNPGLTTKAIAVIWPSLQSLATTPRAQSTDGIRLKDKPFHHQLEVLGEIFGR
jgi:hypothetical protein